MNWLIETLGSSIGKKLMMALSGLSFIGFLVVHLIGNLTIYGGKAAFDSYVDHLHALGPIIYVFEIGLLSIAAVHILTGAVLTFQNYTARPVKYQVNKRAGGRTLGSATMPYTGAVLIIFLVFHVMHFHFADHTTMTTFEIVQSYFENPIYVGCYTLVMLIAGVHVSHGLWSAFQTLGVNHPKYNELISTASIVFGVIVAAGFGFLPVYFNMTF